MLIFIPAKDESASIAQVINNSRSAVENFLKKIPEVLVIDDGSTDDTSKIAQSHNAKVVRHTDSVGLGRIFREAVNYAIDNDFDILLTIDGDGQFSADDIPLILKPIIDNNADFVTGSRFISDSRAEGIPTVKRWGNRLMSLIVSSILGKQYNDVSCGFRVYNREALINLNLFGDFTYTQEVLLNLGFKSLRIKEVPIRVYYSQSRKSRIANNLAIYGWHTAKIIFKSLIYYRPMRLFGSLSVIFILAGMTISLPLGWRYLRYSLISPYKALGVVGLSLIILGFLAFLFGLVMQMLSRIQISVDRSIYYERKRKS